MSIIDRWGVKEHCADCGLPCQRTSCPNYAGGYTLLCSTCGEEWDVALDSPEVGDDDDRQHCCAKCAVK